MEFVAGLYPCDGCGDRQLVALTVGGGGGRWVLRGACPRCGRMREVCFQCDDDPLGVAPPRLELGGPEPSAILTPTALLAEIDRLGPTVATDPRDLSGDPWHTNLAVADRIRTALREIDKFASSDGAVPSATADRAARPERYTRAWLRGEQARWDAVANAIIADAPRIHAADRMLTRSAAARGHLDAAALAAHGAWLARGKAGPGRLDVVISDAEGLVAEGADLASGRLEAVRLRRADLRSARLDDAQLIDCDLRGARLDAVTLSGSTLRGCWFEDAELESATLDRVRVEDSVFDGASLARTRWRAATVTTTRLRGVRLLQAQLDGARFTDCDFRDAAFGALAAGAVFENCDFRGASLGGSDLRGAHFVRCKLAGTYGTPASTDGWSVVFADFSSAGDGSDLGDGEDLRDELAD